MCTAGYVFLLSLVTFTVTCLGKNCIHIVIFFSHPYLGSGKGGKELTEKVLSLSEDMPFHTNRNAKNVGEENYKKIRKNEKIKKTRKDEKRKQKVLQPKPKPKQKLNIKKRIGGKTSSNKENARKKDHIQNSKKGNKQQNKVKVTNQKKPNKNKLNNKWKIEEKNKEKKQNKKEKKKRKI